MLKMLHFTEKLKCLKISFSRMQNIYVMGVSLYPWWVMHAQLTTHMHPSLLQRAYANGGHGGNHLHKSLRNEPQMHKFDGCQARGT